MNIKRLGFYRYLLPYKKLIALTLLLSGAMSLVGLLNPYLAKLLIDEAYAKHNLKLFIGLVALAGAIFVVRNITGALNSYFSEAISKKLNFDLSRDLFKSLQNLPLTFHSERSTGEYMYRVFSDTGSVCGFLLSSLNFIVTYPLTLGITLWISFHLNPKLTFLALALSPLSCLPPLLLTKWQKKITWMRIGKSQEINKKLQEYFSHIYLAKSLGKEKQTTENFEAINRDLIEFDLKNSRLSKTFNFFLSFTEKLPSIVIFLYGGYQIVKGKATLGEITAITAYVSRPAGSLRAITAFYQSAAINKITQKRLAEILDLKPSIADTPDALDHKLQGSVEFKDVRFWYREGKTILEGLNFMIPPASKAALVGASGRGKTTVLFLILRLYEQAQGSILFDGKDSRKIKIDSIKSQIAIALQQPFLLNDTIAYNILCGDENATLEEVRKAAELACAHEFIMNLPGGYDSVIGENACKLSEGQKQRIAIARALLKKPKILILDEAMSSLDSQTEDRIIDNIMEEFKNSTIIVVSHRLATVKKMDVIYHLNGSSQLEKGSHQELVKFSQKYRELFASQIATS
ncbi:MAG: ABC transporter ATP-binding protein [Candidatus Omnitrophica bacterium]|nr:ABC transporter ATP-binding protein [Candidatus Omnitrophota bacterium]